MAAFIATVACLALPLARELVRASQLAVYSIFHPYYKFLK